MNVIYNNGAPPSYKMLMEAFNTAVRGRITPTQMFVAPSIADWFIDRFRDSWSLDPQGFQTFLFHDAHLFINVNLSKEVWFRNPEHPELDVVIVGIEVV